MRTLKILSISIGLLASLLVTGAQGASGLATSTAAGPSASQSPDVRQAGPEVSVETPTIHWGETPATGAVPYEWSARVDNPNDRPVLVKVELNFVDQQGEVLQKDWVTGQVGPHSAVVLHHEGTMDSTALDHVAEARGVPSAWWADEPYKIRTLAAFADGLQRLEVFFVLENWEGRPVVADGTVDLYIVEKQRLQAEFAGGGLRRRMKTLYARRFHVSTEDFARRRIGFISTDYTPPALTLGPIHYSIFDEDPHTDEGLIRVVFRTASGVEIVAEDGIFF